MGCLWTAGFRKDSYVKEFLTAWLVRWREEAWVLGNLNNVAAMHPSRQKQDDLKPCKVNQALADT